VIFREQTNPWMLTGEASSEHMQLNHYFIRSCQHFEDKKRARLISIKARYGNVIPKWFESRVGMGLGNTPAEVCQTLRNFFNTSDTSIVPLATRLWQQIEASKKKRWNPPKRPTCKWCHVNATCVDTLTGSAECTCDAPFVGDGKVFCNEVMWAVDIKNVKNPKDYYYLLGAPDGDKYDKHWQTDAKTPDELVVSFLPDDEAVVGVRMINIFMPFGVQFVDKLKYGVVHHGSKKVHWHSIVEEPLQDLDPFFMTIRLSERTTMNYVMITLKSNDKVPAKVGGVGLVVHKLSKD